MVAKSSCFSVILCWNMEFRVNRMEQYLPFFFTVSSTVVFTLLKTKVWDAFCCHKCFSDSHYWTNLNGGYT
jgi:hypothetical protein